MRAEKSILVTRKCDNRNRACPRQRTDCLRIPAVTYRQAVPRWVIATFGESVRQGRLIDGRTRPHDEDRREPCATLESVSVDSSMVSG